MANIFEYIPTNNRRDPEYDAYIDYREELREVKKYLRRTYGRRNGFQDHQVRHARRIVRARRDGAEWRLCRDLETHFGMVGRRGPLIDLTYCDEVLSE